MKSHEITLDSEVFNGLKRDFNTLANKTINTMLQKEVNDAKIAMTVEIHLEDGQAPDFEITAYPAERDIVVPQFKYKTSATMQLKDEKTGIVDGSEQELVWDKDKCCFVMRSVKERQMSMFEDEDDGEEFTPSEPFMLPDASAVADGSAEVIDADYTELDDISDSDYEYEEDDNG